jgi:hypothetical protein
MEDENKFRAEQDRGKIQEADTATARTASRSICLFVKVWDMESPGDFDLVSIPYFFLAFIKALLHDRHFISK